MQLRKILLFTIAALLLNGCATHLTQEQCMNTNWYQVGLTDGAAGHQQRSLESAITDCMKFKLKVDQTGYQRGWMMGAQQFCTPTYQMGMMDGKAGNTMDLILGRQPFCQQAGLVLSTQNYKRGRAAGLAKFCTYDDGYNIGAQGHQPPEVCPANLRANFMAGWRNGARRFCANPAHAFEMGKSGEPYPDACSRSQYMEFQSEYNRGQVVFQRIQSIQQQINANNARINDIAWHAGLYRNYDNTYHLGRKKSPEEQRALRHIRDLQRENQDLENSLFQARAMR